MLKSVTLLALATIAAARKCRDLTVPLSLSSRNAVFNLEPPSTEQETNDFFLRFTRQGSNYTQEILKEYKNIHGDYEIAATYCEPDNGPGHALQIMTHGVGFDRSYWDLTWNNYNYSYVAKAVDEHGYSTFTWDRLGIGASSKGDAVNEIQSFLEVAALKELTTLLRNGDICGVDHKFTKVAHLGHSFGSIITYNLVNQNPGISDSIVLTGFSHIPSYMPYFALGGNFAPVKENPALLQYPVGYVAPYSSIGVHINFFAPGDFDTEIFHLAVQTGQPAATGELLTLGAGTGIPNEFTGSVLIITGENDVPFCGGDCKATSNIQGAAPNLLAVSANFFKKASTFNTTIVPGAGHGLNMGYSHTSTYASITEFLASHL